MQKKINLDGILNLKKYLTRVIIDLLSIVFIRM